MIATGIMNEGGPSTTSIWTLPLPQADDEDTSVQGDADVGVEPTAVTANERVSSINQSNKITKAKPATDKCFLRLVSAHDRRDHHSLRLGYVRGHGRLGRRCLGSELERLDDRYVCYTMYPTCFRCSIRVPAHARGHQPTTRTSKALPDAPRTPDGSSKVQEQSIKVGPSVDPDLSVPDSRVVAVLPDLPLPFDRLRSFGV